MECVKADPFGHNIEHNKNKHYDRRSICTGPLAAIAQWGKLSRHDSHVTQAAGELFSELQWRSIDSLQMEAMRALATAMTV